MPNENSLPIKKSSYVTKAFVKQKLLFFLFSFFSVVCLAFVVFYLGFHNYIKVESLAKLTKTNQNQVLQASTVQTANPHANGDTKKVLDWIANLPNKTNNRVISGQHLVGSPRYGVATTLQNVQDIYNKTGKWVALVGASYGDGATASYNHATNQLLIGYWGNNGLVELYYPVYNPWTGGKASDTSVRLSASNIDELISDGGTVNQRWLAELDKTAAGLAELQTEGVVVLWRPFHEMTYGAGNWWSFGAGDPAPYIKLWRHMFNYFTNTKGLNNLLWVFAVADTAYWNDVTAPYPGANYVDIVGVDVYSNVAMPRGDAYEKLTGLGKPFAFTENGPGTILDGSYNALRIISSIKSYYPKTVYFQEWSSWTDAKVALGDILNCSSLLADSWIITREEVDWKPGVDSPNLSDLIDFLQNWGAPTPSRLDFNNDKIVNSVDFMILVDAISG